MDHVWLRGTITSSLKSSFVGLMFGGVQGYSIRRETALTATVVP